MESLNNVRVARVSTVPYFVATQLKGQIERLAASGAQTVVITSPGEELSRIDWSERLTLELIEIPRSPHPLKDLLALFRLFMAFRRQKFNIIHSTTPKAGLLSAISSFLARVPIRLHTFTGQPWVGLSGPLAWFARSSDKVIGRLSTHCYADSESQCEFLVSTGVIKRNKISVIGAGSLAGVSLSRFNPARFSQTDKNELRAELGISEGSRIVLFVGRICKDKGIFELLEAFRRALGAGVNAELLLVGPIDQGRDDVDSLSLADLSGQAKVHHVGYTDCPEKYMAIADLLCLPSYREGFGTVVIEAAAMGVPTLGTAIYGLTDAIVNGETGVLVPPRDSEALCGEMIRLLSCPELLAGMGKSAYSRCLKCFDAEVINGQVLEEYERLMGRQ
ncbi:glycosyltransferase family 4 protein [Metapseudomonas furukawaii]|mgnify:CR=1 FL=1|uniref:glycosyltransferase family 4 protein n=1 Tax=Metapseudomonas furukawaii TaxID=1149133 RepID=UPI000566C68E|nr:glycosyltransferase family 4 protein [Pseudomonas furukawaii]